MSDFLEAEWTPETFIGGVPCGWRRDDDWAIEFITAPDGRRMVFASQSPKNVNDVHAAELRRRERDGAAILVPPSEDRVEIAEALAFWPKHPTIHAAALYFAERFPWPKEKQ